MFICDVHMWCSSDPKCKFTSDSKCSKRLDIRSTWFHQGCGNGVSAAAGAAAQRHRSLGRCSTDHPPGRSVEPFYCQGIADVEPSHKEKTEIHKCINVKNYVYIYIFVKIYVNTLFLIVNVSKYVYEYSLLVQNTRPIWQKERRVMRADLCVEDVNKLSFQSFARRLPKDKKVCGMCSKGLHHVGTTNSDSKRKIDRSIQTMPILLPYSDDGMSPVEPLV